MQGGGFGFLRFLSSKMACMGLFFIGGVGVLWVVSGLYFAG